jgi:hypothetical protein
VDATVGRAYFYQNTFTVPYWAFNPNDWRNKRTNQGYFIYYVAHELSHLLTVKKYNDNKCKHDYKFYSIFMEICPKEYQYFELGYKKTAAKYGIKNNYNYMNNLKKRKII